MQWKLHAHVSFYLQEQRCIWRTVYVHEYTYMYIAAYICMDIALVEDLGYHLKASGSLGGEVCCRGRRCEESLLAVLFGGEVGHVA